MPRSRYRSLDASIHPIGLRPSAVPLTIVTGSPASGKNYYVDKNKTIHDIVIDLDEIMARMAADAGRQVPDARQWLLGHALRQRNLELYRLSEDPTADRAWFILCEPNARWRAFWDERLRPERMVRIETPVDACLRRANGNRERENAIHQYMHRFSTYDGDVVVSGV